MLCVHTKYSKLNKANKQKYNLQEKGTFLTGFSFFFSVSNIRNGVQNSFFFQLYIIRWMIFIFFCFLFSIHNTDILTITQPLMRLHSGATNCGVTGMFHFTSNFLLEEGGEKNNCEVTLCGHVHTCKLTPSAWNDKKMAATGNWEKKNKHFFFLSSVQTQVGVSPLQFPHRPF